jgi:SPP1 gp7 family putative phage head morphogenesis protein
MRLKARTPRVGEPIALQSNYFHRLNIMREDLIGSVREFVVPRLEEIASNASRIATDAEGDPPNVGDELDRARRQFEDRWPRERMVKIVEPIAREVPRFHARNLNRQLSSAIGQGLSLDIVGNEDWIKRAVAEFTAENVALIKSIPDVFFSDLERRLTRAIADGSRWEDLAATIEDRYDVTEARARLIAKDQINKLVGDLNRLRQQDLGIEEFIWRTMGDERVRTDKTAGPDMGHVERNGKQYSWDDPPEGETPGEPVNCRCYAEPVIPDVGED